MQQPVIFAGDDGSEVSFIPGEFHIFWRVNLGAIRVRGNPGDDQVLKDAGIDSATLVIAAREDDGENAFISLVAKDLNPNVRVLAVASARGSIRRLKLAGAEIVFAPSVVGGRMLANIVEGKEIPQEFKDLLEGKQKKT